MIDIALIVGSTRPNRFADHPVRWLVEAAQARSDFKLHVVDLRDHPLPFYEQVVAPAHVQGALPDPVVEAWRREIAQFDGFIVTAAEYNHGPSAVLKNAMDSIYHEWVNKPIGFVGYGGVGGARAIEQLRAHAIELQMAPIKNAVHIGLEPFVGVLKNGKNLDEYTFLNQSRDAMFAQLLWWARALKAARQEPVAAD